MPYNSKTKRNTNTLKSFINFRRSEPIVEPAPGEGSDADIMMDARYLRQSSSLISEALQKGFDVLQMANGDIVTTGTKTVVYKYKWDENKGKLVRSSTGRKKDESGAAPDDFEAQSSDELEEVS